MGFFKEIFSTAEPVDKRWLGFAEKYEGRFAPGAMFREERVWFPIDRWTVALDSTMAWTSRKILNWARFSAEFDNPERFRFRAHEHYPVNVLGKLFGMQDIATGYQDFDKAFVVTGNNQATVRLLFENEALRELLMKHKKFMNIYIHKKKFFGSITRAELRLTCLEPYDDLDVMVEVFSALLREFDRIGLSPR